MSNSRYEKYDREALLLLSAAAAYAAGAERRECRPEDLITALFDAPANVMKNVGDDRLKFKVQLSSGLREILDRAENTGKDEVHSLDLLRATAQVCRDEVARYLSCQQPMGANKRPRVSEQDLVQALEESVIGQEHAIRAVVDRVTLRSLGLDLRPERPVGVFLFSGSTGVGKTELGQALARAWAGNHLLRLDCSEFAEDHQVARLIGAPPSYVGYGQPSPIEEFLKGGPNGVILLDEFEKANPTLHRLFLQVFDAGRLTNSTGTTFDLSRIVFIATTNILLPKGKKAIGFTESHSDKATQPSLEPLRRVFPLELLNRFDEIIVFRPLERESVRRILRGHLVAAANAQLERHGVRIELTERAEAFLIEQGYSEELGARNLQRTFARLVLKAVARFLIEPNHPRGKLGVDLVADEIVIHGAIERISRPKP
jgi:ATP-dependent Clp protease ATP-binding subunit ClpA